jgi:hypothetical protein
MRYRVATEGDQLLAASAAEPVLDRESGKPRLGPNGQPDQVLTVVVMGSDGGADVWKVRTTDVGKNISQGVPVRIHGLVATTWELNGRAGVSLRAERIEPASAARQAS